MGREEWEFGISRCKLVYIGWINTKVLIYCTASLIAQLVKNPPAMQVTLVQFLGREDPRDRLPTPVFLGFSCDSAGKESTCNVGDLGSTPGLGRSLEKGKATHSSILAWRIPWTVYHGVTMSQT